MAMDKRLDLNISPLSQADCASPAKLAQWTSDISLKLNQLKTPRFLVKNITYKYQSDADGNLPVIEIKDVGFTPGAVVLANAFGSGTNPITGDSVGPILDFNTYGFLLLDKVQIVGNSIRFALVDISIAPQQGNTYILTLLVFEKDSVNAVTANNPRTAIFSALTGNK